MFCWNVVDGLCVKIYEFNVCFSIGIFVDGFVIKIDVILLRILCMFQLKLLK